MHWIDWIAAPIIIYIAIVPIGTALSEAEKGPLRPFLRWLALLCLAVVTGTAVVVALGAVIGWAPFLIALGFTVLLSGTITALLDWKTIQKPGPPWNASRTFGASITVELVSLAYLAARYAWPQEGTGGAWPT